MHYTAARVIGLVFALSFAFTAAAQDKSSAAAKVSSKDRSFIMQAMNGGMQEIELSKIALQNGASADVKAFAQRMVEEHEKAGKELEMISAKLGAAPPKPAGTQNDLKRLAKLKGAKLDSVYVERMVNGHKGAIALFEKQAKSGRAEELKQFAGKALPVLQEHLKAALALAEKGK